MIRGDLTRRLRAVILSIVCAVMVTSVSGCGAGHALLGVHEAPKAKATSASLTADQARRILTRAFTAAHQGTTRSGAAAGEAQRTAYTGQGLRAVRARVKLAGARTALPTVADSPLVAPQQPRLLAVSRGLGFPRFIFAQTVAFKGGLPILHLLTSPDAATPYRISLSAEMVPPSKIKPFDALSQGSPLVTKGAGLAVAPTALMNGYAAQMAFPAKPTTQPDLPFATDAFSAQVRAGAAEAAEAVKEQASFKQVHKVVPSSVYAVRQASGDTLVFGVIERTDFFDVKSGQSLNTAAEKEFVLLTGRKNVTDAASISTVEFVVLAVPRGKGKATLVAAREQIVAGSGS